MKNECNIIRDILPLYSEDMTCSDTNDFVREHLERCEACRGELSKLQAPEVFSISAAPLPDAAPIKAIQKKWRRKNILLCTLLILFAILFAAYLVILCHRPFELAVPSLSEDIRVTTWLEPWDGAYGNRRFRINFEHLDGKALQLSHEDTYTTDTSGRQIQTGYTIEVRETIWDFFGSAEYQHSLGMAYAYEEESFPDGFDFTITVIYKDQTTTYSMAEMGLFSPNH